MPLLCFVAVPITVVVWGTTPVSERNVHCSAVDQRLSGLAVHKRDFPFYRLAHD